MGVCKCHSDVVWSVVRGYQAQEIPSVVSRFPNTHNFDGEHITLAQFRTHIGVRIRCIVLDHCWIKLKVNSPSTSLNWISLSVSRWVYKEWAVNLAIRWSSLFDSKASSLNPHQILDIKWSSWRRASKITAHKCANRKSQEKTAHRHEAEHCFGHYGCRNSRIFSAGWQLHNSKESIAGGHSLLEDASGGPNPLSIPIH